MFNGHVCLSKQTGVFVPKPSQGLAPVVMVLWKGRRGRMVGHYYSFVGQNESFDLPGRFYPWEFLQDNPISFE